MRQGEQDGSQSVPTEKTQGLFSWRSPTSRAGLSAPQSTPSTSSAEATPQLRKSGCMPPCAFCGKEIWDKPSAKRVTCSKDCKNALDTKLARDASSKPCLICGALVYRPPAHMKRSPEVFCSHVCYGIYNVGKNNPAYRTGLITKICIRCGKDFSCQLAESRRVMCCSQSCARLLIWEKSSKKLSPKLCLECGASFQPNSRRRQFCSRECASIKHSRHVKGEGNGRFVHGEALKKYPRGWQKAHKLEIRRRDKFKCQKCGAPETKPALHVHHINYVKEDIRPENLITLCKVCHGSMHGGKESREIIKNQLYQILELAELSGELLI